MGFQINTSNRREGMIESSAVAGKSKDIFLVLAPHRDARLLVKKYFETLTAAGLTGVYTFPWVAPLALLSRPLCDEELKNCAHSLRELIGREKFYAAKTSGLKFPSGTKNMILFGPCLDLCITDNNLGKISKKIKSLFSPLVIGTHLLPVGGSDLSGSEENIKPQFNSSIPPCEKLEFRAAAVANMFWQPLPTGKQNGFKWKIGKLFWLPRINNNGQY